MSGLLTNAGKIALIGGTIGTVMALALNQEQAITASGWAETLQIIATAVAGAAGAFLVALRGKSK